MQSEYARALARNRQLREAIGEDSQQEKSKRTLNKLSFLLEEFNSENEFLTKQVKDLLQENLMLKKKSRERIVSETSRTHLATDRYETARVRHPVIRQPLHKKFVFDSTGRPHYSPYHTLSKVTQTVGGINRPTAHITITDKLVTPTSNYIPNTHEHERVPQFSQVIEASRIQPVENGKEPPKGEESNPEAASPSSSRRRSAEKRGILVTSKSKSPESRIRNSTSAEKEPNRIELLSPKKPSASEAAVQVTPNLHAKQEPLSTKTRFVTENISLKLEPLTDRLKVEPFRLEHQQTDRVVASQAEQQSAISNPTYLQIREPQRTGSIPQFNILDAEPTSREDQRQASIRRHLDHDKYIHPSSTLPHRYAENLTVQPAANTDNPRRPRILDARDEASRERRGSVQRRQFLSLVGKNRNTTG